MILNLPRLSPSQKPLQFNRYQVENLQSLSTLKYSVLHTQTHRRFIYSTTEDKIKLNWMIQNANGLILTLFSAVCSWLRTRELTIHCEQVFSLPAHHFIILTSQAIVDPYFWHTPRIQNELSVQSRMRSLTLDQVRIIPRRPLNQSAITRHLPMRVSASLMAARCQE